MSILNIKERFSKRILESEKESKEPLYGSNGHGQGSQPFSVPSLHECDVGISEFVSDLPGFHAIIKQRYSDFNVHEIDKENKLVVLDSYELPDESLSAECLETTLIPADTLIALERLMQNDNATDLVAIDVTNHSKEDRKSIHLFVKAKYGVAAISNTIEEDGKKIMNITRNENGAREKRRASHLPKYLHFVLSKANLDTTNALGVLSSKLRLKVSAFNIAGTKDKRANTSQWVSVRNMYAAQLKKLSNLRGIWLGNFVYKDYPLALGSLNGNNFQIALRDLAVTDDVIEDALTKLEEKGFVNYFGLQRFGNSPESATHEVGRLLVKEAFGQAVELILKPRGDGDQPDLRQARSIWARTRDAGQALSALRNSRSIEAQLLQGLKRHGPNAYVNALDAVPRNVRLLYLHAYQSFIWNKVVSRRLVAHGMKVLEGDLVLKEEGAEATVVSEEILPTDGEQSDTEPAEAKVAPSPCPVKHVTAEDVGLYTIYDVVLPLPGSSSVYPNNEVADWYRELLAEDGLTTDSLSSRVLKYSLTGGYRKLLKKPRNVTWRIVRYSSPEDDLILSDAEKLSERTLLEPEEGAHRAVVVSLDLDSSTYATMALREVLRADTSASHQTELGNAAKRAAAEAQDEVPLKKAKDDESSNNTDSLVEGSCTADSE